MSSFSKKMRGSLMLLALAASNASATYTGFATLKTLFTFGDSYTRTAFVVDRAQPSESNPFGNPTYPGPTSSNGENWIQYLTTKYNESLLLTYNFATSGATVNTSLVSSSVDVVTQVEDKFLPYYSGDYQTWDPTTTLFGFWIGINDVGKSYTSENSTDLHPLIFDEYKGLLEKLYDAGARNYLFLNVPPLERMPRTTQSSAADTRIPLEKAAVEDWNGRVSDLAGDLRKTHEDATVFLYDTYGLFDRVIDTPDRYTETAVYKNTTTYCSAYQNGTPEPDTKWDNCTYAANEYMWINSLHPTDPVHSLLAKNVAKLLA
ncbi:cellulose-binding gdsl lipase acylhydrolase [Colletotrichum karsti]|uniref:Cellulose-binding gdsl lipase acylhydrolase n=1 Tax=Colletotrichum karsti TaxID=1095194 RepID=A0A9P6IDL7_9PEZI|nr:cellulose-binding gdsl lipase acylhydrolase [Colletotrichum karsti]KAF9880432.1 cellulose-binding gdsl lipase acylhydrolase [Colletotrichum karsti]